MPIRTRYDFNVFNWVDLATSDRQGAMDFYGALLGWTFKPIEAEGQLVYTICQLNGHYVAGLSVPMAEHTDPNVPPHWSVYVNVEDAGRSVALAQEAGGQLVFGPKDVFEDGVMAFVTDPAGAHLGLWQAKDHIGAQLIREPGAFMWAELQVEEPDQVKAFYRAVFGWDAQPGHDSPNYTVFMRDAERETERYVAGMLQMAPEWEDVPPHWEAYFLVDDVAAAFQRVKDLGGEQITQIMTIPQGSFAVVKDPQGAIFVIMESPD